MSWSMRKIIKHWVFLKKQKDSLDGKMPELPEVPKIPKKGASTPGIPGDLKHSGRKIHATHFK